MRFIIALVAGPVVAALAFVIIFQWTAVELFLFADQVAPAISNVTKNTNATNGAVGVYGFLASMSFSILLGSIVSVFLTEENVSQRRQAILAIAGFFVLGSISGVNFWAHDALISVWAQALLDAALVVFSLVTLLALWRWSPEGDFAKVVRAVSVFLVVAFGIVLPAYFFGCYLLIQLGFPSVDLKDALGIAQTVAVIGSGLATYLAVRSKPDEVRRPEDRQVPDDLSR